MIERLLSSCRIPSDVLQLTCYHIILQCGGIGGFITTKTWDYFDIAIGTYRDRRKGNSKNAIRLWEYPQLSNGQSALVDSVFVYQSNLGWKVGIDSPTVNKEIAKSIIETNVSIAYPIYHACLKIEDLDTNTDQLTGVYTRGKFFMDARGMILTAQKLHIPLWLLYMDLNNFKIINDYFGHDIGDRVLMSISQEIKNIISGYGNLYRIGGDEFISIIVGMDKDTIQLISRRIEMVTEQAPCGVFVNASVGIVQYDESKYGTGDAAIELMLKESDENMYNVKKNKKIVSIICENCHLKGTNLGLGQDNNINHRSHISSNCA